MSEQAGIRYPNERRTRYSHRILAVALGFALGLGPSFAVGEGGEGSSATVASPSTPDRAAAAPILLPPPIVPPEAKGSDCRKWYATFIGGTLVAGVATYTGYEQYIDWDLPRSGKHAQHEDVPHVSQHSSDFTFPCGGARACGPSAAAMALMALGGKGYPGLIPHEPNLTTQKKSLVENLSFAIRGNRSSGVFQGELVQGIRNVLRKSGYESAQVSAEGWAHDTSRGDADDYHYNDRKPPDMGRIYRALQSPSSAVLIDVQWHNHDKKTNTYDVTGRSGHLLLVTGYHREPKTGRDKVRLMIQDPEIIPLNGVRANVPRDIVELKKGTIIDRRVSARPKESPAAGQFLLRSDDGTTGVVRYFVIIEMPPQMGKWAR